MCVNIYLGLVLECEPVHSQFCLVLDLSLVLYSKILLACCQGVEPFQLKDNVNLAELLSCNKCVLTFPFDDNLLLNPIVANLHRLILLS